SEWQRCSRRAATIDLNALVVVCGGIDLIGFVRQVAIFAFGTYNEREVGTRAREMIIRHDTPVDAHFFQNRNDVLGEAGLCWKEAFRCGIAPKNLRLSHMDAQLHLERLIA